METINFFLNMCVFPSDATQFPHRLSRSAWNLAGSEWKIGFSGTNDNHRLLPLSMRQEEPDEPSLLGTNGKMIDRILKVSHGYEVIRPTPALKIPWQLLLRLALSKKAHALIDTGALLAGVLNNDAAAYLLELGNFHCDGVTYYDTRKQFDCWVVLDAASKLVTPLKKSTILEKDTFVIFDDARSRGSDMKLDADAVAVLTLGPKITKDKLMQGAGRMRQLGCDQTLWLASLGEVAQSVVQFCGIDDKSIGAADILDWVMNNTKSEAIHGLLEWANSGLHYSKTMENSDAELLEEDWSLESLYAAAHSPKLISDIVRSKAHRLYGDSEEMDALITTICERGCAYGVDEEILVTSHNEECERELHDEHFEERQGEMEGASFVPAIEVTWEYSRLLDLGSVHDLWDVIHVQGLGSYVRQSLLPPALAQVTWMEADLFGTCNFFSTVCLPALSRTNEFARLIDAMLVFDDGTELLLSECEADHVLRLLWETKVAPKFALVNLSYAVEHSVSALPLSRNPWMDKTKLQRKYPFTAMTSLYPEFIALCQLYNGDTMFAESNRITVENALRGLLKHVRQRESTLHEFVTGRGNALRWRYSLLHELCHQMDLEDHVSQPLSSGAAGVARRTLAQECPGTTARKELAAVGARSGV